MRSCRIDRFPPLVMLLPMLLRSLISGAPSQGETTRRELSRVVAGVPEPIASSMGIKPALPSSPSGRQPARSSALAEVQEDEGVADVDEPGAIEEEDGSDAEHDRREEAFRQTRLRAEAAARDNGKEGVKIGFFLHTPFPSSEIYRILPVRREILLGVLQCDLIGWASRWLDQWEGLETDAPPNQLPHVRLCPPLPLLVHAHPRPRDDAQRRPLRGALRARWHVPHRH